MGLYIEMDRRTAVTVLSSLALAGVVAARRVYNGEIGWDCVSTVLALIDNLTRFKWNSHAFNRVSWIAGLLASVAFGDPLIYTGISISLGFAILLNRARIKTERLSFYHGPMFMLLPICYFAASQLRDPLLKIIVLLLSLTFLTPASLPLLLITCYPIAVSGTLYRSLEFVAMTLYQINLCLDFFEPIGAENDIVPISIV